ncbi:hypothetical protein SAMN04488498_10669 [Mesorhizobium albiziae]|uniref:Lipoprotein n=1 Tax=Neomesorhizobium albiziae TaxID=335020 RepID=A0A1I3ZAR9_9HYPH|nr:hypothetical protein [Mesorhizobium albiziae]GLS32124.1 hypothetical protein GCM10007937_38340 [Mesorhizobium albiziae]SFK41258.1 hypothetical protein SAMN04488498_10669 [Mesorhizobium albiziae]
MKRSVAIGMLLTAASALAACTSTEQALDPSAIKPPSQTATAPGTSATASIADPSAAPGAPAAAAATPGTTTGQVAAIDSNARIQIAPIVGATVEAAGPLSERIAARAKERGIKLAGGDGTATLVLKGYFSAITEARETTVIYVWDVLDTAGNRLHRIQGQQKAPARRGEGWASVSAPTMQGIADQTVDQLAAWLGTRAG